MVRIILARTFDTPVVTASTLEKWISVNRSLIRCMQLREVRWLRSYISADGKRSICEYDASYVQVVREACRESETTFDAIWQVEVCPGQAQRLALTCPTPILVETP